VSVRARPNRQPRVGGRSRAEVVLAPQESRFVVGSVIKKRRKRMAKKKHRKLLKRTRVQRRNKK